jgi:UMF1 family MFS transporter
MTPEKGTLYLGFFNTIYALAIALIAPVLGAISDQGAHKKRFLLGFTLLGALGTALIPVAAQGQYVLAGSLFAVAAFGFSGNSTFYDALITDVATKKDLHRVSSFGFTIGYIGSELLFVLNTLMVMRWEWFGFEPGPGGKSAAVEACFWMTGLWWALFTIPAILWVREKGPKSKKPGGAIRRGFAQFAKTLGEVGKHRQASLFLAAYILYIDGVNTIITMAVDFGMKIGLDTTGLILSIHMVQIVSIPATILYGMLGQRFGIRKAIFFGIAVYAGICLWAFRMSSMAEFWIMAFLVGAIQGGLQALSRSYFATLIPRDKSGEFFGFFNTMGEFAAVLGPVLMGLSAYFFGTRASVLSLLALFLGGALILARVKAGLENPGHGRRILGHEKNL